MLQKHSILKIYLPVEVEDQESVAKGKLVLNKVRITTLMYYR